MDNYELNLNQSYWEYIRIMNDYAPFCLSHVVLFETSSGASHNRCSGSLELKKWRLVCVWYFWRVFLQDNRNVCHEKEGKWSLNICWITANCNFWTPHISSLWFSQLAWLHWHIKILHCSCKNCGVLYKITRFCALVI